MIPYFHFVDLHQKKNNIIITRLLLKHTTGTTGDIYTKMQVELKSETVVLTSENNKYTICLNKENKRVIPRDHDVSGIFIEFPPHLVEVRVIIGNSHVAVFDRDMQTDLSTFPLYLTLSKYMYTELELVYDKEWLLGQEEHTFVDEYVEEEELGDEATIWDGYEYHEGRTVMRRQVPTGKQVRKITKGVSVALPTIVFNIKYRCDENANHVYVDIPVKQKIKLADLDSDYKEKLIQTHDMKVFGQYGIVKNYIRYGGGTAGLKIIF